MFGLPTRGWAQDGDIYTSACGNCAAGIRPSRFNDIKIIIKILKSIDRTLIPSAAAIEVSRTGKGSRVSSIRPNFTVSAGDTAYIQLVSALSPGSY